MRIDRMMAAGHAPASMRLAWPMVALLSVAAIFSYIDRVVINLMVESIKADLRISDTGFGALQGFAFGLFYTLMAFPLGLLADRYTRRLSVLFVLIACSAFSVFYGLSRA